MEKIVEITFLGEIVGVLDYAIFFFFSFQTLFPISSETKRVNARDSSTFYQEVFTLQG